ncbi:MAG TPA: TraR/DksA C4-type zinc finger protein, partial [Longimicrobiales bacterium]|nr:TraR/DksA C4-type zinc finger protein [Longimicrobiales bacterium]
SQEGRQLLDIDEALRKLYKEPESFGKCESCGREISMERLEIVPWARLCIDCKRAAEEQGEGADIQSEEDGAQDAGAPGRVTGSAQEG